MSPSLSAKESVSRCLYCGESSVMPEQSYCCTGCQTMDLWQRTQRSQLRPSIVTADKKETQPHADTLSTWSLDLQGIHCSACLGIIKQLFGEQPGAHSIDINPALGQVRIVCETLVFDLPAFQKILLKVGYRLGPQKKETSLAHRNLLIQIGICAALTMNSMVFSFAFYFGLDASMGRFYTWLVWLNALMAFLCVWIGGRYFFKRAWFALQKHLFHVDIPITLGIIFSFLGSVFFLIYRGPQAAYFDTVCGFITLMLIGQYLPRRILEKNRSVLLKDEGVDTLMQKVLNAQGVVVQVPYSRIQTGDTLLFAPGDLVCVDILLMSHQAACRLDFLNGEPFVQTFSPGHVIPSGAMNASGRAFIGQAQQTFLCSRLRTLLLAQPGDKPESDMPHYRHIARFSQIYVVVVLGLALLTFMGWFFFDFERALFSAISVLVVSCPCAIGLATPLAYELALFALRQKGVFMRKEDALFKIPLLRSVVFDKTGTLTDGALTCVNKEVIHSLDPSVRAILKNMVQNSNHPVSVSLNQVFSEKIGNLPLIPMLETREFFGQGIELSHPDGCVYRLGHTAFALGHSADSGRDHSLLHSDFSCNGRLLARFLLSESVRQEAQKQIQYLIQQGFDLYVLSGDQSQRTRQVGVHLGFDESHCLGHLSPEQKAEFIKEYQTQHPVLMIGDGMNDSLAFAQAFCSAVPLESHLSLPYKVDFFYRSQNGLCPIDFIFAVSRHLQQAERFNYTFALLYNLLVLSLAMSGYMTPLFAAFAMPLSSIFIVSYTFYRMRVTV